MGWQAFTESTAAICCGENTDFFFFHPPFKTVITKGNNTSGNTFKGNWDNFCKGFSALYNHVLFPLISPRSDARSSSLGAMKAVPWGNTAPHLFHVQRLCLTRDWNRFKPFPHAPGFTSGLGCCSWDGGDTQSVGWALGALPLSCEGHSWCPTRTSLTCVSWPWAPPVPRGALASKSLSCQ